MYREVRDLRGGTSKLRDSINERFDDLNKRIDSIYLELLKKIDSVRTELSKRIDDTNKRIDKLYELLMKSKRIKQFSNTFLLNNQAQPRLDFGLMSTSKL